MPKVKASLLVILTTILTVAVLFWLPYTPTQVVRTMVAQRGEWMRSTLLSGMVIHAQEQLCVSPKAGRVSKVCVQPGQQVKKGELLFLMDTSVEERSLQAIYQAKEEQKNQLLRMDETIAALAVQQELQWMEREQQLILAIESAQIRAEMDGEVGAVYAVEGSFVETAGLLGSVHNGMRCVSANGRSDVVNKTGKGALAALEKEGQSLGAAEVDRIYAPLVQNGGMQQLTLLPLDQEQLGSCEIGDAVTVELLMETLSDRVPIPLSAVDENGRVWFIENGCAHAQVVDTTKRNGETIAASAEWEGRTIILSPGRLYEGCPVKEAKK